MSVYNVNIGVLGHVDSGKTSLCKALSTQGSTASFDKSPQSKERGITLDLGFSAFYSDVPKDWGVADIEKIQYTLVDCPGHASLIKTIIGGAQIIDMMVLVIDANKGIQTQTAECIVIGEMLATSLIIVINKCDLIAGDKAKYLEKLKKRLTAVFSQTKFKEPHYVCVSAAPGANDKATAEGLDEFRATLASLTPKPRPVDEDEKKFLMYVDHCFAIEGQGTILTGTILEGRLSVGQTVYFPTMKMDRKVRGIQVFRKPVKAAHKGDRIGMSVSKFDSTMERGIVCALGSNVQTYSLGVARIQKVRFYKSAIPSNLKLHVTVGHSTVMGAAKFFYRMKREDDDLHYHPHDTHYWLDELEGEKKKEGEAEPGLPTPPPEAIVTFALISFEQPLTTPINATLIASKLDTDVHANICRLCFQGHMECAVKPEEVKDIRAMKEKVRNAAIDRVVDDYSCIGKNLVTAKTGDLTKFIGMKILFEPPRDPETGNFAEGKFPYVGTIDSSFGKSGKFKVVFKDPVFRRNAKNQTACPKYKLYFRFRVNHFDKEKKMCQDHIPAPGVLPPGAKHIDASAL
eukprot:TRINITY_DN1499_c0_g2_i2.p1 TRINITY_DN1499_c0_g2~~TRINITY_DN1499_c0_g2_i2.p1  ORF type:complete len:582 (+),score=183.95 TRINITY_DN1499_c0_g2_i2:33-1748(+)